MGRKLGGGLCPFRGGGARSPPNSVARAEAYLHAKFHLDPANHLATVHERHRQDRTDRQRTDNIKWFILCYGTVVLSCLCCLCDVRVLWPNGRMDQNETWHGGRPWPVPHCVRGGPSSPQKGHSPSPHQFLAHVCCGPTAGWIKIPLGMEVGLGPGDYVLDC